MALKSSRRINRRQAIVGLLAAAGGAFVSPPRVAALAVPGPGPGPGAGAGAEKAYAAFFLGQGGLLFSWGIPYLASQARELGMETDIFSYADVRTAWKKISQKKDDGYKIALVGYSLGNTTITYLQRHLEVDLLLAISESSLGRNHRIKKENTKRSVLWYGPDFLSNAGLADGFDKINYVENTHLLMDVDPRVANAVVGELKKLVEAEKNGRATVLAKAGATPTPVRRIEVAAATTPAPVRVAAARFVSPGDAIARDVTCFECWGF